ncbi:DUF29 domain-containing protein [Endozoicomonas sp. SESOKO2]|uniref:DUF29 domain-containing protein n=1 Tax=Endozoicomonas sp. SESOKO2 TaxID=2828743 RepID=UPI002147A522|nr:DUF29 domain-containing protein [Endozoicomonas sp. SESOKO2]
MNNDQKTLYVSDFYSWTKQQAQLIKERRFNELDLDNLAEEVEGMGKHEPCSLTSHLMQLLMHLLKWQYQPERRSRSWRDSIILQRAKAKDVLDENPGLKPRKAELYKKAYKKAVVLAARQTELPLETFPSECPWTYEAVMHDDFLPENPPH